MEHCGEEKAQPDVAQLGEFALIDQLLGEPDSRHEILQRKAERLQRFVAAAAPPAEALHTLDSEPGVYDMTPETFARLFDEEEPTVVVDVTSGYRGSSLTAQTAQRRRLKGQPSVNMLLIRADANCADLVQLEDHDGHMRGALRVTHGIVLGPNGDVHFGALPRPIYATTVETTNRVFLDQCAGYGITTLNNPENIARFVTKGSIPEIEQAGLTMPPRIPIEGQRLPELPTDWERAVIKPGGRSSGAGKGVGIFLNSPPVMHHASDHYKSLRVRDAQPVVEKFIESYPLHDPATGQQLAWDVRVLSAYGTLLDVYLRLGPVGTPTNTNSTYSGNRIIRLEELKDYLSGPDAETKASEVTEWVIHYATALASTTTTSGIVGDDLLLDPNLKGWFLERNIGRQLGGLDVVYENTGHAEAAHGKLVAAWCEHFAGRPGTLHGTVLPGSEQAVKRDVIARFKGLHELGRVALLADVSLEELDADMTSFDRWLLLTSQLYKEHWSDDLKAAQKTIGDIAVATPLEFMAYAHILMERLHRQHGSRGMLPFALTIDNLLDIFPDHPGLLRAKERVWDEWRRSGQSPTP